MPTLFSRVLKRLLLVSRQLQQYFLTVRFFLLDIKGGGVPGTHLDTTLFMYGVYARHIVGRRGSVIACAAYKREIAGSILGAALNSNML